MNLGYLTQLTQEECELGSRLGYDCLEVHAPWEPEELSSTEGRQARAEKARGMLSENGLTISAIALYYAGPHDVEAAVARYEAYIRMCGELKVDVICAMSGGDPEKTLDENIEGFKAIFSRVAPQAEEAGVRIAFENWPALSRTFPPVGSANLGFTPAAWERMFEAVDSDALGLEFDPSHLVWQGIDWAKALERFASRVYHVHAKDTEVLKDRLASEGFFSQGWWRYRLPGYGCVDWHKFTSMLKEQGYEGNICVEHEDPVFSGERREEGLRKVQLYLRALV